MRSELRELERLRDQAQKKYERTKNIVLEEENKLKTYKTQLTEIKAQILARDKEIILFFGFRSDFVYVCGTIFSEMADPIKIKLGGCIQFTLGYCVVIFSTSGPEVKPEVGFPTHENAYISPPNLIIS